MKKLSGFPLFKISMAVIFLVTSTGQASAAPQPISEVLSESTIGDNPPTMEFKIPTITTRSQPTIPEQIPV